MKEIISISEIKKRIPPLPGKDLREEIKARVEDRDCTIIVLDDDPTGTQTVHGISVLTEWTLEVIKRELDAKTSLFFIMTNSRSLVPSEARELAITIGKNIGEASRLSGRDTLIISRSDSTLRGHYPVEVEGLMQASGNTDAIRFIIPAFFEGGRITFEDVHYVREKEQMVPAAQTPYAKDAVFGYKSSDLKEYVEEKTGGEVAAAQVSSISIQELREHTTEQLLAKIASLPEGSTCIVNAADPYDLQRFVIALLDSRVDAICRTAASFVSAIAALPEKELLDPSTWIREHSKGRLLMVGSHVPKSSAQLQDLLSYKELHGFELNLSELLFAQDKEDQIKVIIGQMNALLQEDETVLVYTQRALITAGSDQENLKISEQVSALLCRIVSGLHTSPHFIIAKGGITSSDIATKSLHIKKALVMGQVFPGVPVWQAGSESKFPGMPYVVFPGNVGEDDTISHLLFPS